MEQKSEEWLQARAAKITASEMHSVMTGASAKKALCHIDGNGMIIEKIGNGATADKRAAKIRSEGGMVELMTYDYSRGAGFASYRDRLAAETITNIAISSNINSRAIRDGNEREPDARALYETITGHTVVEEGLIIHKTIPYLGASPDGLIVGKRGGVEIKCPNEVNHMNTVIYGMPEAHKPQVQANILVNDADFWDFISYNPAFAGREMEIYIERIYPDPEYLAMMRCLCAEMHAEVQQVVAKFLQSANLRIGS